MYVAQADSVGHFSVGPLGPGTYLMRGTIDQNRNRKQDRTESWDTVRVGDLMVPLDRTIVLREDGYAVDAAAEIADDGDCPALVVSDGRLVGLVSLTDVARVLDVRLPAEPAV